MPETIPEEALVRQLQQTGLITNEQLGQAQALRSQAQRRGMLMSLGEACVQLSLLTEDQYHNLERRYQTELGGALGLVGQYRLVKKLGEGAMGAVYLAEDTMMGRQVALKMIPEAVSANPSLLSRFKREAVAAGKLNHVNITGGFAFSEEGGKHYYVMEYCKGESLDALVKRLGQLPEAQAISIAYQVAQGLQFAHEHGIIHRDIKPANVVLTPEGTAKVLDLGLSKNMADTSQSSQTMEGVAVGTPDYISPEQARGEKNIDGRADVYALGTTLYHLVTGQTPFPGESAAVVMVKHLTEAVPDPRRLNPQVSEGLALVIAKAMAKTPPTRYQNMSELIADLEAVQKGERPRAAGVAIAEAAGAAAPGTGAARRPGGRQSGMRAGLTQPVGSRSGRGTGVQEPVGSRSGRGTGVQEPVSAAAGAAGSVERPRAGRAGQRTSANVVPPALGNRKTFIVGGVVAGILLLIALFLAFSGSGEDIRPPKKNERPPDPIKPIVKDQTPPVRPPEPVVKPPEPVVKPPEPVKKEGNLPLQLMPRGNYYINSEENRTMRFPLRIPPLPSADCELAIGATEMTDDTGDGGMYCKVLDQDGKELLNQFSNCGGNMTWFKIRVKPDAPYTLIMEDLDTSLTGAHPGNHFSFEVWVRP
jgi:hypothetical protein